MTAQQLRAWQARMGLTYDGAAAALGVSRATYARWLADDRIDRRTELACAAIEAGIRGLVPAAVEKSLPAQGPAHTRA